jgi:signal transduction histidine kinase
MEYNILSKVIEYAECDMGLEGRLKKVSRLLTKNLPFDSSAFYVWDDYMNLFLLSASGGTRSALAKSYGKNEGLPALVRKARTAGEAYTPKAESTQFNGTEDRGLKGFRYAAVYPLAEGKRLFGIVYLKAREKPSLPSGMKELMKIISQLMTSNIKCTRHYISLKNAHARIKDTQTKLIQAEKLLVLGELSATLAHEIKNPLVSVGGFASRLKKKLEPDTPLMVYVDYIVKEVASLENIIDGILAYAADKGPVFSKEDINLIISEALTFFSETLRDHKIRVVKGLSSVPSTVLADRHQLKIAFDNLIANAIQSMDEGGTLTITSAGTKHWVVVDVSDSGGGIEPGLLDSIFTPFFTTKKFGSGLGLDITRKIISKHSGHIDVANNDGKGVTFTVKLPRVGNKRLSAPWPDRLTSPEGSV